VFSLLLGALLVVISISLNAALTKQQTLYCWELGVRVHGDLLVQLINVKCMPILLDGTDRGMRRKQTSVELAGFHRYPA
jgi:hypothetical protein